MADSTLVDLAQQVLEVSHSKEHQQRRDLWVQFHALRPPRPLGHYAMYPGVWEREIAHPEQFRHHAGLARLIEVQLRAKLWKA
jgi:hypothetical protein